MSNNPVADFSGIDVNYDSVPQPNLDTVTVNSRGEFDALFVAYNVEKGNGRPRVRQLAEAISEAHGINVSAVVCSEDSPNRQANSSRTFNAVEFCTIHKNGTRKSGVKVENEIVVTVEFAKRVNGIEAGKRGRVSGTAWSNALAAILREAHNSEIEIVDWQDGHTVEKRRNPKNVTSLDAENDDSEGDSE